MAPFRSSPSVVSVSTWTMSSVKQLDAQITTINPIRLSSHVRPMNYEFDIVYIYTLYSILIMFFFKFSMSVVSPGLTLEEIIIRHLFVQIRMIEIRSRLIS